ncbi:type II toxin-antitoxin system RelE/ParE family toxin [Roseitalea porphyridii]|jgi:toxin ParE1/3/4|uniref:type II toxin-antitoxin system RelE/ParE family toxin n=1 Tax=Roseitalea porphyridii TaxID=1852022 RepID=UPI0032EC5FB2
MPSGRPTRCRLTPQASTDLETIWVYTREQWSERQADTYIDDLAYCFDRLVAMPLMARERTEFTPPVRIHPILSGTSTDRWAAQAVFTKRQ